MQSLDMNLDMALVVHGLSWVFMVLGSFFVLVGALGLLRMPDVFTRMHAASVIDTLGAGFLVAGMILQAGLTLVTLKLLFIIGLLLFTGPVAAHALGQAALHAGIKPRLAEDRTQGDSGNEPSGAGSLQESNDGRGGGSTSRKTGRGALS